MKKNGLLNKNNKELVKRVAFTISMLFLIRLLTKIPVPFLNSTIASLTYADQDALGLYNRLTGGGLEEFSIFSLSISPYITSSILVQLLSILFPSLETLQKDGEYGKKKIEKITRKVNLILSFIQAFLITAAFSYSRVIYRGSLPLLIVTLVLVAGSLILMWMGNKITKYGVGNGISLILLLNILSRIPKDIESIYGQFIEDKGSIGILYGVAAISIALLIAVLTIYLNEAIRKIPIQYSKKMSGKFDDSAHIPLKLNVGNVMPIIFASSILALPSLFALAMQDASKAGVMQFILKASQQNKWFDLSSLSYSVGYIVYVGLMLFFSYFYAEMAFNPTEIAYSLKRSGGSIPNVRSGSETEVYLKALSDRLILFGALYLLFICSIPIILIGILQVKATLLGTSIIIIVSIFMETYKQINVNRLK